MGVCLSLCVCVLMKHDESQTAEPWAQPTSDVHVARIAVLEDPGEDRIRPSVSSRTRHGILCGA